eukprot:354150-Chlamydomonas_euryale.AAC.2
MPASKAFSWTASEVLQACFCDLPIGCLRGLALPASHDPKLIVLMRACRAMRSCSRGAAAHGGGLL